MSYIQFKNYKPADKEACLAIFDSNCPKFFAAHEYGDFVEFLTSDLPTLNGEYYILQQDGKLIGCGGYHVETDTGIAKLCWGMINQAEHKTGLGKKLLEKRLDGIRKHKSAKQVHIDTSQHTAPFFEHFGFAVLGSKPDGYGPGIDHVEMVMKL